MPSSALLIGLGQAEDPYTHFPKKHFQGQTDFAPTSNSRKKDWVQKGLRFIHLKAS
jgi:hypothetical protein